MSGALGPGDFGLPASTWSSLSAEHVERIAATLDRDAVAGSGGATAPDLPPLWHWAFFTPTAPTSSLGADGHPPLSVGPARQLPRRMWAGGSVRWIEPLRVGTPAERRTTLGPVEEKQGRSGRLLFVALRHEYVQDGAVCIDEVQNLVYREPPVVRTGAASEAAPPTGSAAVAPVDAAHVVVHEVREPLLLRYSAITFNAHRIHYDRPYATEVEGYQGLVVHGPLLATLVTAAACDYAGDAGRLASISYRGVAPATAPGSVTVTIDPLRDADDPTDVVRELAGRARRADGEVAMEATFALHDEVPPPAEPRPAVEES